MKKVIYKGYIFAYDKPFNWEYYFIDEGNKSYSGNLLSIDKLSPIWKNKSEIINFAKEVNINTPIKQIKITVEKI